MNTTTGIVCNQQNVPGDHGKGETPDPIPNSEVKPFSAECTARVAVWENRTLPGQLLKASDRKIRGLFVLNPPLQGEGQGGDGVNCKECTMVGALA